MAKAWGDKVFQEVGARLERLMPDWSRDRTRIVIYAAGGHTRDLVQHEDFLRLNLVGLVDRNPALHGQTLGPLIVSPAESLLDLQPELVLLSSPRAHEAIRPQLEALLRGTGVPLLDLYEGVKPYAQFFAQAEAQGFRLEDTRPGQLRLIRPGPPVRTFVISDRHWIYVPHLLEAFDYYFDSVEPDRMEEGPVVDIASPAYHTLRRSGARLLFPSLPEPDATTEAYLEVAQLQSGDHVLDLGAYAGGATFAFSKAVGPSGRVIALEPDATNLEALRRNVREHALSNVSVLPAAIWEQDGASLFQQEGCTGSSLGEVLERDSHLVEVPTFTLKTLLEREGIHSLRFIKMDIEGAETRVIAQAMPVLQSLRPRMVIEPHVQGGALNTPEVRSLLEKGGFRTWLIEQGLPGYPLVAAEWRD